MKNDQVLTKLLTTTDNGIDDLFDITIKNIARAIEILMNSGQSASMEFIKSNFLHIGSTSRESMEAKKHSILQMAWPGKTDSICFEMHLDETQSAGLFDCFKGANDFGCYVEKRRNYGVPELKKHYFFESELFRFRIHQSSTCLTLICWYPKSDPRRFDEEIHEFLYGMKKLDTTLTKEVVAN